MKSDPALLDTLHAELRDKLTELTTSDDWLEWLHGARQFHRYSPQNQLLLMLQGAHGHVAGYKTWQRIPAVDGHPCQVRKGEHGLTILAPLTVTQREIDETSGEEVVAARGVRGFRAVKVFHRGQLVAPPDIAPPKLPAVLTGEDRWQHVWTAVVSQLGDEGYDVSLHTAAPYEDWNGRTNFGDGEVRVMDHLAPPQQLKTLLHEWAHVALGHSEPDRPPSQDVREVEAESVAYLLCSTIGLDSSRYSLPYVAGWSGGDGDMLERTAQRVLATTTEMVAALDHKLSIDLSPDLLTVAGPSATPTPLPTPNGEHPSLQPPVEPGIRHLASVPPPPTFGVEADSILDAAPRRLRPILARLDPVDRAVLADAVTRLDRDDGLRAAVALCADTGADAASTAELLTGLGADRVELRRAMKGTVTDQDGRPRFLFDDDVDAAFRVGPTPAALAALSDAQRSGVLQFDVDRTTELPALVRTLRREMRPAEVIEVLRWLGVADAELEHASPTLSSAAAPEPLEQSQSPALPRNGAAPAHDPLTLLRSRVTEHEALFRRVVDEDRNVERLAALATGLGMSYAETVAACAHIGLDPEFTAQVALQRRGGAVTLAASDLTEGWSPPSPAGGWGDHLPTSASAVQDSEQDVSASPDTDRAAARSILTQWASAATPTTTPAMP